MLFVLVFQSFYQPLKRDVVMLIWGAFLTVNNPMFGITDECRTGGVYDRPQNTSETIILFIVWKSCFCNCMKESQNVILIIKILF